jgi:hypothetical protein
MIEKSFLFILPFFLITSPAGTTLAYNKGGQKPFLRQAAQPPLRNNLR